MSTKAKDEKKNQGKPKTGGKVMSKEKTSNAKGTAKSSAKTVEKTAKTATKAATKPTTKQTKTVAKKETEKKTVAKASAKKVAETKKPVTKKETTVKNIASKTEKKAPAKKETTGKKVVEKKETSAKKATSKKETAVKVEGNKTTKKTAAKQEETTAKSKKPVKTPASEVKVTKDAKKANKNSNEEESQGDDPFFLMRLEEVIKKGKNNKGILEMSELNDAFDSLDLSEEVYDKIYATLDKNGIIVRDSMGDDSSDIPSDDFFKDSEDDLDSEDAEIISEAQELVTADDGSEDYLDTTDPVKAYLKEIGRVPLLSADQEIVYAKDMEEGNRRRAENDELMEKLIALEEKQAARPTKTTQNEINKITAKMEENRVYINKGIRASKRLAEANLRLVVSIAKRYVGRGMQLLDLVQEGNLGLGKAVEKFDYRKGFKFSTYATWWVRQAITRAIADQARTIRIPVHMVETINKIVRVNRQLVQELGREPATEEIAERMGMTEDRVREIMRISQEPTSLETPIGEEEDSHLGDFLPDDNTPTPEDVARAYMLRKQFDKALDTLTERERRVLVLRFGLEDGRPRTLEEVGKDFAVTRERIRQIEAKALRRLKQGKVKKLFEGFL